MDCHHTHLRAAFCFGTIIGASFSALADDASDSVSAFYSDKEIRFIIGYSPGGGYDLGSRMLARYLAKYIPGHPKAIVPTNMPGAGGYQALNWVGQIGPKDGTVLYMVPRGTPQDVAMGGSAVRFDFSKMNWICNINESNPILLTGSRSRIKSVEDARQHETLVGTPGVGNTIDEHMINAYNRLLGLKLKAIPGYPGANDIYLAIERGEVDGIPTTNLVTLQMTHRDWLRDRKINFILQLGLHREKGLENVSTLMELVSGQDEKEEIARFLTLSQLAARPIATSPDVPQERVNALREACARVVQDPAFIAESEAQGAPITYMTGAALEKIMKDVLSTPPAVIGRVKDYLGLS